MAAQQKLIVDDDNTVGTLTAESGQRPVKLFVMSPCQAVPPLTGEIHSHFFLIGLLLLRLGEGPFELPL